MPEKYLGVLRRVRGVIRQRDVHNSPPIPVGNGKHDIEPDWGEHKGARCLRKAGMSALGARGQPAQSREARWGEHTGKLLWTSFLRRLWRAKQEGLYVILPCSSVGVVDCMGQLSVSDEVAESHPTLKVVGFQTGAQTGVRFSALSNVSASTLAAIAGSTSRNTTRNAVVAGCHS